MLDVWILIRANKSFWLEEKFTVEGVKQVQVQHSVDFKGKKEVMNVPSPSALFSKSCFACSLEMRLLPSKNSRNFCEELRAITR